MLRLKRAKIFADFANNLASLSKCTEKHVAAVITDKDMTQVYSIGINGGPVGGMDCMCQLGGKYGCVHAEINALVKCTSDAKDKIMFVTMSPCVSCAAAIINAPGSFYAVYYNEQWKNTEGLELLHKAGVHTIDMSSIMQNNPVDVSLVNTDNMIDVPFESREVFLKGTWGNNK